MKLNHAVMPVLMAATAITGRSAARGRPAGGKALYKAPAVEEWRPRMLRLRVLGVIPENGGHVNQVPGPSLQTSNQVVPELDISYSSIRI